MWAAVTWLARWENQRRVYRNAGRASSSNPRFAPFSSASGTGLWRTGGLYCAAKAASSPVSGDSSENQ